MSLLYQVIGKGILHILTNLQHVIRLQIVLPCKVESKQGLLQWTKDGFGLGVDRELPGYSTYSMVGDEETGQLNVFCLHKLK